MAENKLCPKCGSQMFMATITRACVVAMSTDKENPYQILKEGKDKFDIEIVKCARCKEDISETDLVVAVKCKECGRLVAPHDVDENGICDVCNAMHKRSELANATKEDLIKLLLEAEKRTNPVAAKMEEQIEKANVVLDAVAQNDLQAEEEVAVSTEAIVEEEPVAPVKRRGRRKKTEEDTEVVEAPTEAEATEVENIANQQEAPFPDMNLPEEMTQAESVETASQVETTVAEEEQPIGAGDFKMFDDSSDSAF